MRLSLSISLLIFVAGPVLSEASADSVVPYALPSGDELSPDFVVRADGKPIDVTSVLGVAYAHFGFSGDVEVEIKVRDAIGAADVSPHRERVETAIEANRLTLQLSKSQKLHLQIDELPRLFIFADAIEAEPPILGSNAVYDVRDFEVVSSTSAIQTEKLQRAIDFVAAKKGTLYVPPGVYRCGQLSLKSDLTLYLAPGSIIKGTGRPEDYPVREFGTQQIALVDCRNVRIAGRGVIDGQGRALRLTSENSSASRMKLIRSFRASQCIVEGVVLRDSGTWGVHLIESSDIRFSDFKLISNTIHDDPAFPWEPNTDGFDPDNSSRIVIEGGFVSCNDDAVAVKLRHGKRRDSDSIVFRDNVVWTVKSALKIGSEVAEKTLSDVSFERNDVVHADRGIVVYCYFGGTVENCRWTNNWFEFIGGDLKQMHVEIKIQDEDGRGRIRDLEISDCTFEREAVNASRIVGLDAAHSVAGVKVSGLTVEGQKIESFQDARIDLSRFVTDATIE